MEIAFIGAGRINFGGPLVIWNHCERLESLPDVKAIIGICDVNLTMAKNALESAKSRKNYKKFSKCRLFDNTASMLREISVNVFVEKPLSTLHPSQFLKYFQEIQKSVEANNLLLGVGYHFRYHPAFLEVKRLIDEHGGLVMAFQAEFSFAYTSKPATVENPQPFWWDPKRSGGPIVEQATHGCDLARFLVGEIDMSSIKTVLLHATEKAGYLSKQTPSSEDYIIPEERIPRVTSAHWKFNSGGVGSLIHTVALQGKRYESTIKIWLDGLRICVKEPYSNNCKVLVRDGRRTHETDDDKVLDFSGVDPYINEMSTFMEACRKHDQSLIKSSYEDALKTYQMTWGIREAGEL